MNRKAVFKIGYQNTFSASQIVEEEDLDFSQRMELKYESNCEYYSTGLTWTSDL